MKLNKRKGFTIVELVIVIAVIAILAAVLIPNISNLVKKANASADESLVRNLNTALSMDVEKHQTMDAALEAAKTNGGYDLTTIVTKNKDNKILWDSKNDCFVYMKKGASKPTYLPNTQEVKDVNDVDYFEIVTEKPTDFSKFTTYSIYAAWTAEATDTVTDLKVGFDAGKNTFASVEFVNNTNCSVLINTNGGKLTVDASKASVTHRGVATIVTINAVATKSYHEMGTVNEIKLKAGRVVVEDKAEVGSIFVTAETVGTASDGTKTVSVEVKDNASLGAVGTKENITLSEIVKGASENQIVGKIDNSNFAGGFGTEKAPFYISDHTQLEKLSDVSSNEIYVAFLKGTVIDAEVTLSLSGKTIYIEGNGAELSGKLNITADSIFFNNISFAYQGVGGKNGDHPNTINSNSITITNSTIAIKARTGFDLNVKNATLSNNTLNSTSSNIYNIFEFGKSNVEKVLISDNHFNGQSANNCISFYNFAEKAVVDILNNKFEYVSNAIRISNVQNVPVTFNITNNSYTGTDFSDNCKYAGFILLQDYSKSGIQNFTCITLNITDLFYKGEKLTSSVKNTEKQIYYVYDDQDGIISTNQPVVNIK